MAESKPKPVEQNDGVKMVQIPESQLKEILTRLDILTTAADRSRLDFAMGSIEQKPIVRRVNLNIYRDLEKQNEFVILGWAMVIDEVFVTMQGLPYEKQIIRLYLEDADGQRSEKGVDVDYLDFVRRTKKQAADILSTTTTEDGKTFFKVKRVPDGKEYTIDKTFIN